MTRAILFGLLLVSLWPSRADAQSFDGIGRNSSTVSTVFHIRPGDEGSLYCFNVQANFTSIGPIVVNGVPNQACQFGWSASGGAFSISVTPGFNLTGYTL